ncbi:uncharacterized protein LOC129262237 [Lytechinus pictus]|uniref:uncharacterized protein LOC129262237 n=1 Tax=Lytechinus pictus TaxID=7653 RepID=UPI0030BA0CC0
MAESSSKECKIPEELKKFTRAVLLSKIGGVPLEKFSSDFKNLAGYPLHFEELGFSTLRSLLEAMPDAVRFEYSNEASKWMLYGIGDPNTYMSSAAKKAQYSKPGDGTKDNNNRKRNRRKSGKPNKGDNHNNNDRSQRPASRMGEDIKRKEDGELRIPRSNRGFYSVCVYYNNTLGEKKTQIIQEIVELFATQGDVVENSCVKNLMFFRFLTEDEAISVIKLYNGRCLSDGTQIRVQPASERLTSNNKKPEPSHGKPSLHEQRKLQGDLIHQHLQHNEPILTEQQMFQQQSGPWPSEAYAYMSPYIGMQEAYARMHGGPFLQGHPHMNNDNFERRVNPAQELCVRHLNRSITVEDIMSHFWPFNPLFARMRSKTDGNDRKYFAFVAFGCIADAHNAEVGLQGSRIKGCRISLEIAKTKRHTDSLADGDATLRQDKNSNNVKPTESRDQRDSSLSDVESVDSISAEVEVNDDPNTPSYMDSKIPIIDDSPYTANKTSRSDDTMSSGGSEDSSVTSQQGGVPFGRGRGSLPGYMSPSPGRGLALLSSKGTEKKKPRPSLADLADRLHEL